MKGRFIAWGIVVAGFQDNGTTRRVGDSVWRQEFAADPELRSTISDGRVKSTRVEGLPPPDCPGR